MTDDVAAKLAGYRERGARQVKLGLTDIDGVIRGKYVSLEKFAGLLAKGGGFCDCVFGWDVADELYDGGAFTGWHTGFPDADYRLVVDTERWLPDEGVPYFVGEFASGDDAYHPVCPRSTLRRTLDRAAGHGLALKAGFEYEFFVFDETPHSVREKHYRDLRPLTPGNFGYSVLRASSNADLFRGLMNYCDEIDTPLEGLHCETGPGVWEGALAASNGLSPADRATLFKTFSKVFFARHEAIATFMAKWSMDYPGQSGHFHFSLLDDAGDNAFGATESLQPGSARGVPLAGTDPAARHHAAALPDLLRHAVGGLVRYVPELLTMLAPTVNSYTRLVKGAWAPTAATWGFDNRTTAFRVISGAALAQRIECRVSGADANPYLAAAAALGAAVLGIEQAIEPPEPVVGNGYDAEDGLPDHLRFPSTLREANARFAESDAARTLFGDAFVEHYVTSRDWETREAERTVTDWQLARYFEII